MAGCSDGGSPPSSDATPVPTTHLLVPTNLEQPNQVVAERAVAIEGHMTRTPRELLVAFTVGTGSCGIFGRVAVLERPDAVIATVYVGDDPTVEVGPTTTCTADGRNAAAVVPLGAPLGHRKVLDGSQTPPRIVPVIRQAG